MGQTHEGPGHLLKQGCSGVSRSSREPWDEGAMPRLRDRAPDEVQDIYGWCGLCNAFSGFPHLCTGEDHPAEDQDDNGL
jgi:hypothetical protein